MVVSSSSQPKPPSGKPEEKKQEEERSRRGRRRNKEEEEKGEETAATKTPQPQQQQQQQQRGRAASSLSPSSSRGSKSSGEETAATNAPQQRGRAATLFSRASSRRGGSKSSGEETVTTRGRAATFSLRRTSLSRSSSSRGGGSKSSGGEETATTTTPQQRGRAATLFSRRSSSRGGSKSSGEGEESEEGGGRTRGRSLGGRLSAMLSSPIKLLRHKKQPKEVVVKEVESEDGTVEGETLLEKVEHICSKLRRRPRHTEVEDKVLRRGKLWLASSSPRRELRAHSFELRPGGLLTKKKHGEVVVFEVGYAFGNASLVAEAAALGEADTRDGRFAAGFLAELEAEAALTMVLHVANRDTASFCLRCASAAECAAWVEAINASLGPRHERKRAAFAAKACRVLLLCADKMWRARQACLLVMERDEKVVNMAPQPVSREGTLRIYRGSREERYASYALLRNDARLYLGAKDKPRAIVSLQDATLTLEEDLLLGLGQCSLQLATPLRSFRLQFRHFEAMFDWVTAMREAVAKNVELYERTLRGPPRGRGLSSMDDCWARLCSLRSSLVEEVRPEDWLSEAFAAHVDAADGNIEALAVLAALTCARTVEAREESRKALPPHLILLPFDSTSNLAALEGADEAESRLAVKKIRRACENWLAPFLVDFRLRDQHEAGGGGSETTDDEEILESHSPVSTSGAVAEGPAPAATVKRTHLPPGRRLLIYKPAAPTGAKKEASSLLPQKEVWVYLAPGANRIGRAADCAVSLGDADPRVSRYHATIHVEPHSHAREHCPVFPFPIISAEEKKEPEEKVEEEVALAAEKSQRRRLMRHCPDCRCTVCGDCAADCESWSDHCYHQEAGSTVQRRPRRGGAVLSDAGSRRGTALDGTPCRGRAYLSIGQRLVVGRTELIFCVQPDGTDDPLRHVAEQEEQEDEDGQLSSASPKIMGDGPTGSEGLPPPPDKLPDPRQQATYYMARTKAPAKK